MFNFFKQIFPTKEIARQMLTLATAGFGLVSALAWNEAIQAFVNRYLSFDGAGVVSKLIYAVIITILAVLVTVNLTKFKDHFEEKKEEK